VGGITLQWRVSIDGQGVQGTIRFGAAHEKFGDPYEGCLSIMRQGDTAELYAATGDVRPYAGRLRRLLRAEGIGRVQWERHRANGAVHNVGGTL